MWWMMWPTVERETPIEEFPPMARAAVVAARAMNANVKAAADMWQSSVSPDSSNASPFKPPMVTAPLPMPNMFAPPIAAPFGMWPPMFMSVETRDGETRVAVGQKLPALPFVRLPRIEF